MANPRSAKTTRPSPAPNYTARRKTNKENREKVSEPLSTKHENPCATGFAGEVFGFIVETCIAEKDGIQLHAMTARKVRQQTEANLMSKASKRNKPARNNCELKSNKQLRDEAAQQTAVIKANFPAGIPQPALRALCGANLTSLEHLTKISQA